MAAVTLDTTPSRSSDGKVAGRLSACTPGAMAANTDLLTAALTPIFQLSVLRVTVSLATAAVFSARITPSGAAAVTVPSNQGAVLPATAGFTFELPAQKASTYNFRCDAAVTVNLLQIEEIESRA